MIAGSGSSSTTAAAATGADAATPTPTLPLPATAATFGSPNTGKRRRRPAAPCKAQDTQADIKVVPISDGGRAPWNPNKNGLSLRLPFTTSPPLPLSTMEVEALEERQRQDRVSDIYKAVGALEAFQQERIEKGRFLFGSG